MSAQKGFDIDKRVRLIYPIQEAVTLVLVITIVGLIAFMVTSNTNEQIAPYLVFLYLLKRSATAFSAVGSFRGLFAELQGMFVDVASVFDDNDKYFVPDGKNEFAGLRREIEFKDLSFRYLGDTPVLSGVNFYTSIY